MTTFNNRSNAKQVLFLEPNDTNCIVPLDKAQLEIILLPEEVTQTCPDRLRFHVSTNVSVPLRHEDDSAFRGFGVDEIVEPDGYSYANGLYGHFAPANPFYDVYKTETPGLYEATENGISIKLLFLKGKLCGTFEAVQIGKAILIHEWPNGRRNTRAFDQVAKHDFPTITP